MKRSGPPKRRKPLERQTMVVPRPRPLHARRRQRPLRARRATPGVDYKAEATRLHSLLVRHRAGDRCERCGQRQVLECAHIVPRRYSATRTDERNGWGLCRFCHGVVDTSVQAKQELAECTVGLRLLAALWLKADPAIKADTTFWRGEYERLVEQVRLLGLA